MKELRIVLLMLVSTSLFASTQKAPPNFPFKDSFAVFVDFKKADYKVVYDFLTKSAFVESTIIFDQQEAGYPIFDLVENPNLTEIDGRKVNSQVIVDPTNVTSLRVLSEITFSGEHTLKIKAPLVDVVEFKEVGVFSAFWADDLGDRGFLENYVPSNLEYDQFEISLDVSVLNSRIPHTIYTNGRKSEDSENHFTVKFPAYYNSSSVYFHLAPKTYYKELAFNFTSINSKVLPVLIYTVSGNLTDYKNKTVSTLSELERIFGAFPHNSVTIYGAGSGGMEYHGATVSDISALGHELTHSYFARGMMPANGDSGWIDEAIASWRDYGYSSYQAPNFSTSRMGNHSLYKRSTDREAYTKGQNFMGHLNYLLKDKGGLKNILKIVLQKHLFNPIRNDEFKTVISDNLGRSVDDLFNKYIFGKTNSKFDTDHELDKTVESKNFYNPFHKPMTKEDLKKLMF